jgi:hypothetical protein
MDLLLIVNDALHTDKFHRRSTVKQGIMVKECGGFVTGLVEHAATCISEKESQAEKKLRAIINYWGVNQLLSAEDLKACRDSADEALYLAQGGTSIRKRNYFLPEYHGDKNAEWHDLPASYMLDQMIKHPKRAIDPNKIKVQKLNKKPVTPYVHSLLDNFFDKIDLKYVPTGDNPTGETKKYKLSLDPMGQMVKQDKETGETAVVANGYGWSMKFCEDMREHGVPKNIKTAREDIERMEDVRPMRQGRGDVARRTRTRSSSAESDYRRYRKGHTGSSSHSRSRSRSYRRRDSSSSYDNRRSPPGPRSRDRTQGRPKISPRPIRKDSNDRGQRYDDRGPRPPPRPYSRGSSQSGPQMNVPTGPSRNVQGGPGNNQYANSPMPPQNYVPPQNYGQAYSQPPQPPYNAPLFPPQPPMPGQFQGQFPMSMQPFGVPPPPPPQFQGHGAFVPPPPPPPPNYHGPWIPPPPPNMNMNAGPNGPQYGGQYGNNVGPGNNFGSGNPPHGQNQGGRGSYGGQRGGYNGNRGGWRGTGRGGRY